MTANIAEMGLFNIKEYVDYTTLVVVDWVKFFPVINIQAERPLVLLATSSWYARVSYNNKKDDLIFNVRIGWMSRNYIIDSRIGRKFVNAKDQQELMKLLCPYGMDDIRRQAWFSVLKQYNYAKICGDTQDVLTTLLVGKND